MVQLQAVGSSAFAYTDEHVHSQTNAATVKCFCETRLKIDGGIMNVLTLVSVRV